MDQDCPRRRDKIPGAQEPPFQQDPVKGVQGCGAGAGFRRPQQEHLEPPFLEEVNGP